MSNTSLTTKSLSKTQVRNFLHLFNFKDVEALLDVLAEDQTHRTENIYGTGVSVRYIPEGNRYYISIEQK